MQDFAKGTGNNKVKWPKDMEMFWIPLSTIKIKKHWLSLDWTAMPLTEHFIFGQRLGSLSGDSEYFF